MQNPEQYPPQYEGQTPPSYAQQAYTQQVPPTYGQSQRGESTLALVLEAVCAVFSIYGIGWLYHRKVGIGLTLLIGGFIWLGVAGALIAISGGALAFCVGPMHLLFIIGDVLWLNREIKARI
jgi:hypothetical protein